MRRDTESCLLHNELTEPTCQRNRTHHDKITNCVGSDDPDDAIIAVEGGCVVQLREPAHGCDLWGDGTPDEILVSSQLVGGERPVQAIAARGMLVTLSRRRTARLLGVAREVSSTRCSILEGPEEGTQHLAAARASGLQAPTSDCDHIRTTDEAGRGPVAA